MKRVLIDIDETITDNISNWREWYRKNTGITLKLNGKEDFSELSTDPLLYFKRKDMYKNNVLNSGVREFIDLIKDDYIIVFCSCCYTEHIDSKKAFLERNFNDIKYHFVDTCSKHLLDVDYAIDDRAEYLRGFRKDVVKFQIKTEVNRDHSDEGMIYSDWNDIIEYFKKN